MTIGEAVVRLRAEPYPFPISADTLRRMCDRGEIPTAHIGTRGAKGDRRIPTAALDAFKARKWAEAHSVETAQAMTSDADHEAAKALVASSEATRAIEDRIRRLDQMEPPPAAG